MKNCILKGLCVFFILLGLLITTFTAASNAQSGHGGSTEVIARIVPKETQPLPTQPTEPIDDGSGKLMITAIRPASANEKEQSYVYEVAGPDQIELTIAIVLKAGDTSGSVVISCIPSGEYTVTELRTWSWRYSDSGTRCVTVEPDSVALASFDHTLDSLAWLNSYSHRYFQ